MAGQLIQRGERTWLVRIFLGRDETTGRRRYLNQTIHGQKKDAQRYQNKVLRDLDTGTLVEPTRSSLNEYLDRWLETAARPRVRKRTLESYEEILRLYIRPLLGDRPLAKITTLDVQAVYNALLDRGLSPRTVRYAHSLLDSAFFQAVKWRLISGNPTDHVELPRQAHKEMRALSPAEAQRFLDAAREDRHFALFSLLIDRGLRPGEALGLKREDLDLQQGNLSVRRTLTRTGEFTEPKTARARRSIKLSPTLVRNLREHLRRQAEDRLARGPDYVDRSLLFASENGEPIAERNLVRRHFKPALQKAGLDASLRLYDLRHSCASILLAAGEHPKIVSDLLGHASVALTLDTYSHVLPSLQQQAAERMEAMLYGGS